MGTWDVIVVGSRIAGASTALLLARAGLRVLVLDRARRGSDTLSTHALMRAGVLQLSRWGVLDEVVRGTPPVRRTLFHYYDEDPVTVSSRPSPGVPALYAPRRTVLDTVLADAAERAGATVRHGTAVTGVLRDEHGRVTGVRTRRRGGPDGAERAPLVVGADGLRSAVADAVGAPVLWRGEAATNVLYGYVTDLPAAGYEWYYGAGVGAGLIPTHDGLTCVFAGTTRTELDRLLATVPPAVALTLLARRLPDLVERLTAGGQRWPWRPAVGRPTPCSGWATSTSSSGSGSRPRCWPPGRCRSRGGRRWRSTCSSASTARWSTPPPPRRRHWPSSTARRRPWEWTTSACSARSCSSSPPAMRRPPSVRSSGPAATSTPPG